MRGIIDMSKRNDGGPAFPQPDMIDDGQLIKTGAPGMNLRDYFAAKALQVMLEKSDEWNMTFDDAAEHSYAMADIMLEARETGQ